MSPKQQEVLDFITATFNRTKVPPSLDEIVEGTSLRSKSNVSRITERLIDSGHLRKGPEFTRKLYPITQANDNWVSLGDAVNNLLASVKYEQEDGDEITAAQVDPSALGELELAYQEAVGQ